jgi:hypothetical protein
MAIDAAQSGAEPASGGPGAVTNPTAAGDPTTGGPTAAHPTAPSAPDGTEPGPTPGRSRRRR